MKKILLLPLFVLSIFQLFAQNGTVAGRVTDYSGKEALPGVNVYVYGDKLIGAATDLDGNYTLSLPAGNFRLVYSFVGYEDQIFSISVKEGETTTLNVKLRDTDQQLGLVVVSVSKFEKKLDEETISMEVLKPNFVEDYNAVNADQALQRVPGVNLVGEQINIRGGSGYSGGAGSRVLVLLDGVPYLAAQNQGADLKSLPMENLEQIEVIKGAASSLYGSSALNGIVNVRTAWPKNEPFSKITLFSGAYSNPFPKGKKHLVWYENRPIFGGGSFVHRKKWQNFDLAIGGNYNEDSGYLLGNDVRSARMHLKTRWRPKNVENLSLGLNTNLASWGGGFFFLWQNYGSAEGRYIAPALEPLVDEKCNCLDSLAYVPAEMGTQSSMPITFDPWVLYFDKKNNMHNFRGRYYFIRQRTSNGEDTDAASMFGEYTFHSRLKKLGFDFVTGISATYADIESKIVDKKKSENAAVFLQIDKKFWDRLTLTFGGRMEYIKLDTLPAFYKPIFRGGVNFQAAEGTYFRASAGQGFRYPSASEKFTATVRNGIRVIPNPDLKEETGWSAEVGVKQGFKISNWFGYFDASAFVSRYRNMIDFDFAQQDGVYILAFQAQNLMDNAQISGFELSTIAQGKLFGVPFNFIGGYTFLDPIDLDPEAKADTTRKNILNYRSRHSAKADIQATYKKVVFGVTTTYNSFLVNVDKNINLLGGISEFRQEHDNGQIIFDVRAGCEITENAKVMLLAKNLANTQYSIRPGFIEAPRNYTVQFSYTF